MDEAYAKCRSDIIESPYSEHFPVFYKGTYAYGGKRWDITVSSIYALLEARLWARIKEVAVKKKNIVPLFCETNLGLSYTHVGDQSVEADLVKKVNFVRGSLNTAVDDDACISADTVNAAVDAAAAKLRAMDKTIIIELNIISDVTGAGASNRVCNQIVKFMPSEKEAVDAATVLQRIATLKRSSLYKHSPLSVQGNVKTTETYIAAIQNGNAPNWGAHAQENSFLSKIIHACQFFFRFTTLSDTKGSEATPAIGSCNETEFVGAKAVSEYWETLKPKVKDGTVTFDELLCFTCFRWLVPDNIKESVDAALLEKSNSVRAGLSKLKRSQTSDGNAATNKKSKETAMKATEENTAVMKEFGIDAGASSSSGQQQPIQRLPVKRRG